MTQQPVDSVQKSNSNSSDPDNHEHLIHTRLKSLVPECDTVKAAYEACFQDFFPRFLKGARFDPCKDKLKTYTSCLRQALTSMGIDMNEIDATRIDPDAIAAMLSKN